MRDPRPVFWLLIVQLLALVCLVGWWVSLPPPDRLRRLGRIMLHEGVPTLPPQTLLAQGEWLYTHRLGRLIGLVGVVAVATVIGIAEGINRRRRDVLGGFLLTLWTYGIVALGLTPGVIAGVLLAPWPLPVLWVAGGLALHVGCMGYCLLAGRPYVP